MPPHIYEKFMQVWKFFDPSLSPILHAPETYMKLSEADLTKENMKDMWFAQLIELATRQQVRSGVNIFCVPEKIGTGKERKRSLAHTLGTNLHFPLTPEERVLLPSFIDILRPVKRGTFVCCVDLSSYYNQFELPQKIRDFFCFTFQGQVWRLKTIPTGQRHCVGVAQMTTLSLTYCLGDDVEVTVYVDNVRFVGDNKQKVIDAAMAFCSRCKLASATLNEVNVFQDEHAVREELANITLQEAEFLGMKFDHVDAAVNLQEKTVKKLRAAREEALDPSLTFVRFQAIFSLLLWCSRVLDLDFCNYFHIFKFLRRRSRTHAENQSVDLWPCLKTPLAEWCDFCIKNTARTISHIEELPRHTLYTDACLSGWGLVLVKDCVEGQSFVTHGAPWFRKHPEATTLLEKMTYLPNKEVHINELELRTVLCSLVFLDLKDCAIDLWIDNTTAQANVTKGHSASFFQNEIIREIKKYMKENNVRFSNVRYVKSAENPADDPSRWFAEM